MVAVDSVVILAERQYRQQLLLWRRSGLVAVGSEVALAERQYRQQLLLWLRSGLLVVDSEVALAERPHRQPLLLWLRMGLLMAVVLEVTSARRAHLLRLHRSLIWMPPSASHW